MSERINFFRELKRQYDKKQWIRWLCFTYPKTTALGGVSLLVLINYLLSEEFKSVNSFNHSFSDTVYATDKTSRRNDRVLVYDSSKTESK